ncbi:MAG: cell division protein ZapE, partial [Nocardia sp.]|nr:cell division protein ZapE [Nocardia sp.]
MQQRLVDRHPDVPADQLIAQMVPPHTFDEVSFDSYIPDPNEPSQAAAVRTARDFAERVATIRAASGKKSFFHKKKQVSGAGLYLDGGFGVGKTHLLASIFHAVPGPKSFGTFGELTNLVGALGFANAVDRLAGNSVLCIDEFELDDPGDTMLVSRLLSELTQRGVSVAATSNTLPDQLGEGRFAAQDFLREIRKLGELFEAVRVDGPDYRHRDLPPAPEPTPAGELADKAAATPDSTLDDFDELLAHLSTLHPSKFGALIAGVRAVYICSV